MGSKFYVTVTVETEMDVTWTDGRIKRVAMDEQKYTFEIKVPRNTSPKHRVQWAVHHLASHFDSPEIEYAGTAQSAD